MISLEFKQEWALFELGLTSAILLIYFLESLGVIVKKRRVIALGVGLGFSLPLFFLELPIAAYIRGTTGDLSVMTLLLLWSAFFIPGKPVPNLYQVSIILVAILFYPYALGLGMIDPYAWGYGSLPFFVGLLFLGCLMWWSRWDRMLVIFSFAILAWCLSLHESTNLWDYLLDPFLVVWCVFSQVYLICNRLINSPISSSS